MGLNYLSNTERDSSRKHRSSRKIAPITKTPSSIIDHEKLIHRATATALRPIPYSVTDKQTLKDYDSTTAPQDLGHDITSQWSS
jgi:hypothetical protein